MPSKKNVTEASNSASLRCVASAMAGALSTGIVPAMKVATYAGHALNGRTVAMGDAVESTR